MKRCQTCGEKIGDTATTCPRCLQKQTLVTGSLSGQSRGPSPVQPSGGAPVAAILTGLVTVIVMAGAGFLFFRGTTTPPPVAASGPPVETPAPAAMTDLAPLAPAGACTATERTARFTALVAKRLGKPEGFEPFSTTTGPVDGDKVTVIMTYRRPDNAGSRGNGVAIGKVDLVSCVATIEVLV